MVAGKGGGEEVGNRAVFDFVLIASGGGEIPEQIGALNGRASAIVFQLVVVDEIAEFGGWNGGRVRLRATWKGIGGGGGRVRIVAGWRGGRFSGHDAGIAARARGEGPQRM